MGTMYVTCTRDNWGRTITKIQRFKETWKCKVILGPAGRAQSVRLAGKKYFEWTTFFTVYFNYSS